MLQSARMIAAKACMVSIDVLVWTLEHLDDSSELDVACAVEACDSLECPGAGAYDCIDLGPVYVVAGRN